MDGTTPEVRTMDVTMERDELRDALRRVRVACPAKHQYPVLHNVRIEVTAAGVLFQATNLDLVAQHHVARCEVGGTGATTAPLRQLLDVVEGMAPDRKVRLVVEGYNLVVDNGANRARLMTMSDLEWPTCKVWGETKGVMLDDETVGILLDRVLYAASLDETRFNLNSVYWEGQDGRLRMTCTDGHRLATTSTECTALEGDALLPRPGMRALLTLLAMGEGPLEVAFPEPLCVDDAPWAVFRHRGTALAMRFVEGQYPDYRQIMVKEDRITTGFNVDKGEFIKALQRCRKVLQDKTCPVKLEVLQPSGVRLTACNPDKGDMTMTVAGPTAGPIVMAYNAWYLEEALKALPGNQACADIVDALAPMRFKSPTPGLDVVVVIMPMRL